MFPLRSGLLRAAPIINQTALRTNVSGPPAVRMSLAEKAAHMTLIALSMVSFPIFVLTNVKHYRDRS